MKKNTIDIINFTLQINIIMNLNFYLVHGDTLICKCYIIKLVGLLISTDIIALD